MHPIQVLLFAHDSLMLYFYVSSTISDSFSGQTAQSHTFIFISTNLCQLFNHLVLILPADRVIDTKTYSLNIGNRKKITFPSNSSSIMGWEYNNIDLMIVKSLLIKEKLVAPFDGWHNRGSFNLFNVLVSLKIAGQTRTTFAVPVPMRQF